MKRTIQTFGIAALFLCFGNVFAKPPEVSWSQQQGRWIAVVTQAVDAPEKGLLQLQRFTGKVTVQGDDQKDGVLVFRFYAERGLSREKAEKILSKVLPDVTTRGRVIDVQAPNAYRWGMRDFQLNLDATLPVHFDLDLNVIGGDLQVNNLNGKIELAATGGDIEVQSITGSVSIAAKGGDLDFTEIQGSLSAATSGGDIQIKQCSGSVEVATSGGEISVRKMSGALTATSMGGDIVATAVKGSDLSLTSTGGDLSLEDIQIDDSGELVTSGGDIDIVSSVGDLDFITSGGDVRVNEHKGDLQVGTGAGDVTLQNVAGSVTANVGTGDIHLSLLPGAKKGGKIELSTGTGSVDLYLPKTVGGLVEATVLAVGGDSDRINSDYSLNIVHAPGGRVRATGEVNGGGIPILLNAGYGSITIRRN